MGDRRTAARLRWSRQPPEKVIRTASRLASGLNARWLVVSLTQTNDAGGETSKRLDKLLDWRNGSVRKRGG